MKLSMHEGDGLYLSGTAAFALILLFSVSAGLPRAGAFSFLVCIWTAWLSGSRTGVRLFFSGAALCIHMILLYGIVCEQSAGDFALAVLTVNAGLVYAPLLPSPWQVLPVSLLVSTVFWRQHGWLWHTDELWQTMAVMISAAVFAFLVTRQREVCRARDQYHQHSRTDALTGLYTFEEALEQGQRRINEGRHVMILFLDFDNFKSINDHLGHFAGNQVLIHFAEVLRKYLPAGSVTARLGGDEFLILLAGDRTDRNRVGTLMGVMRRELNERAGGFFHIHFSYGIVDRKHHPGMDIRQMIDHADEKMYYYKSLRDEFVFVYDRRASLPGAFRELLQALKEKDIHTYVHSEAVAQYSAFLAREAGLGKETADCLYTAGWLHDIGKLLLPNEILIHPGELDKKEKKMAESHISYGMNILQAFPLKEQVLTALKTFHERFDGTGYPRGLSGKNIPEEGRIMAVANLYAKLTIRRIDREKMSREGACEWLQKESGHMLDPEMTGLFIRALEEKEKNGGEDHD